MTTHADSIIAADTTSATDDSPYRAFDLELPFAWEHGPGEPDPGDRDTVFRFPSAADPEPATRRLLGMSLYASMLGIVGLAVAIRGVAGIIADNTPGWYEPTVAAAGLADVALVVAAFLSIHRRRLPWLLLIAAAIPLIGSLVATANAF